MYGLKQMGRGQAQKNAEKQKNVFPRSQRKSASHFIFVFQAVTAAFCILIHAMDMTSGINEKPPATNAINV